MTCNLAFEGGTIYKRNHVRKKNLTPSLLKSGPRSRSVSCKMKSEAINMSRTSGILPVADALKAEMWYENKGKSIYWKPTKCQVFPHLTLLQPPCALGHSHHWRGQLILAWSKASNSCFLNLNRITFVYLKTTPSQDPQRIYQGYHFSLGHCWFAQYSWERLFWVGW